MKAEAAVLVETCKPLEIFSLDFPKLKRGQVLVDISYSGICRSQINEIDGLKGIDRFLPHTLGHEGSGIVIETGPGVTKVKPGDHVVLSWMKGSGQDVPSTLYQSETGIINSGAISTFMNKTIASENRLTPIPKEMPMREAALLGCAVPTGAGIILNNIKLKPGDSIAVFGLGGIGLSAIMASAAVKANIVIAIDILQNKLDSARALGATHVINSTFQEPLSEIKKITDGAGVNFTIEAAGRVETMETAYKAVKYQGGHCILAGNLPKGKKISIDPMDLINGKNISGTFGGETVTDIDIPKYTDWFLSKKMKLSNLITQEYALYDINKAIEKFKNGHLIRAMIKMSANIF